MIIPFQDKTPQIADDVFIAPNAVIIGDVTLGAGVNIWFGAVLRGDLGPIVVGERTSIQDNCVLHVNYTHATHVGADVIVGHGVIMEGCDIGNGCMLGMNATILSGAVVGQRTIVAAGSLVKEDARVPEQVLVAGVPATVKKQIANETADRIVKVGIANYQRVAGLYKTENLG